MAGGVGSRIWPMSTQEYPKQFVDVLGCGKTLIQLTAERFENVVPVDNIWVVTSDAYADIVFPRVIYSESHVDATLHHASPTSAGASRPRTPRPTSW